jgi:hypothetical protein
VVGGGDSRDGFVLLLVGVADFVWVRCTVLRISCSTRWRVIISGLRVGEHRGGPQGGLLVLVGCVLDGNKAFDRREVENGGRCSYRYCSNQNSLLFR